MSTDENNVRQYKLNETEPEQSQFVNIAEVFKENEQFTQLIETMKCDLS